MNYKYIERTDDKAIFAASFSSADWDFREPIEILGPIDRWQAIDDGGCDPSSYDWSEDETVERFDADTFGSWSLMPKGDW